MISRSRTRPTVALCLALMSTLRLNSSEGFERCGCRVGRRVGRGANDVVVGWGEEGGIRCMCLICQTRSKDVQKQYYPYHNNQQQTSNNPPLSSLSLPMSVPSSSAAVRPIEPPLGSLCLGSVCLPVALAPLYALDSDPTVIEGE